MSKLAETEIMSQTTPVVEAAGCELVEVTWGKDYSGDALTFFVFKEGGVSLDDCERVHNALDLFLDNNEPSSVGYTLNVSSLGLDRPIVTLDDFRRSLNTEIEVFYQSPVGKAKSVVGVLSAYDTEFVTLNTKKLGVVTIEKTNVAKAMPFVRF